MHQMGCTHVATPETWPEVLQTMGAGTDRPDGGKGVDFVLEMVGHNQETVEMAIDLCKPSATVVCFGVPDDKTYVFPCEYPLQPTTAAAAAAAATATATASHTYP